MVDITAFTAAFESIKVALDIGKYLKTFNDTLKNSEFQGKLNELNSTIVEIQTKLIDAQQENINLQRKLMQLEQYLIDKSEFKYDKRLHVYWKIGDTDSPYCPTCFEKDSTKIRMYLNCNNYWQCRVCKSFSSVQM